MISGNSFTFWERIKAVVRRKLDPDWIKTDYKGFNYITYTKAVELLNEAFGMGTWSVSAQYFDPISYTFKDKKGKEIIEWNFSCLVTIKLPEQTVLTGSGSCSAQWNQFNTGFKGAFSDGFKKAMTQLGFFMELYPDSTDNPLVWAEINKQSGLFEKLKILTKDLKIDGDELVKEWSLATFIGDPIYTTKTQTRYLYPSYLKSFVDWVERKVNNEKTIKSNDESPKMVKSNDKKSKTTKTKKTEKDK